MESNYYISLNNFKVKKSKPSILIDNTIKELLIDPISLSYFIKPIYLPDSTMIYDHQSIKEWLLLSDLDPLTGIKLNKETVKVIPVLNYFLALLCLEEINNEIYFHPPNGNIFDILQIAEYIFNDYQATIKFTDGIISLDLTDYTDEYSLKDNIMEYKAKIGTLTLLKPIKCLIMTITLEDILARCPVSRRIFNGSCLISNGGLFVHRSIGYEFNTSRSGTLSEFNNVFRCQHEYIYNIRKWNDFFKHIRFDDQNFQVIQDCESKLTTPYHDVETLKIINVLTIEYPKFLCLSSLFVKNCDSIINRDWYLSCRSTEENIYQFYLKHKDGINDKTRRLLSDILDKSDFCNFGNEFILKREFYGLPTVLKSAEITYGNDYSFLEIKNKVIRKRHFKMFYFVGTQFINTIFDECEFACCVFIAADMSGACMINCKFKDCSLYNIASVPIIR